MICFKWFERCTSSSIGTICKKCLHWPRSKHQLTSNLNQYRIVVLDPFATVFRENPIYVLKCSYTATWQVPGVDHPFRLSLDSCMLPMTLQLLPSRWSLMLCRFNSLKCLNRLQTLEGSWRNPALGQVRGIGRWRALPLTLHYSKLKVTAAQAIMPELLSMIHRGSTYHMHWL